MKHIQLTLFLMALVLTSISAQQETPAGMRYQAIARDPEGIIRSNEPMQVKADLILLEDKEMLVYSELHAVTSGEFGLLNITIGEGEQRKGSLHEVPWEKPVWIRISIQGEKDPDFQLVTTSKLYSVPYAFYAAKAGEVLDTTSGGSGQRGGVVPNQTGVFWALSGNANAHQYKTGLPAVLGTTDRKDLTMITNNIPRLIIDKDGDVQFLTNINLDGDLNVEGNTTLQGSLTVENMSPTHLTGTLRVDKATTLNSDLTVENAASTLLTGSLGVTGATTIKGATTIENTLAVTNGSATLLTGSLAVDGATTMNNTLTVANMSPSHLTGKLDVDQSLNVDGPTTLNNTLAVTGQYPTHLTGTLRVDQATTLNDDLTVANMAMTHLTGNLKVDGPFETSGDVVVDGSFEVTGGHETHLTGTLDVDQLTTMHNGLEVSGPGTLGPNGEHIAYFNNTQGGSSDGIAIRIANPSTNAQNNFVTFYKGDNSIAGRIEGYTLTDLGSPPVPTGDEIWSAVCVTIADYNPVTIMWTQFASKFNLFGTVWNGATIPSFDIPDFPGLAIPDFPGLVTADFPGLSLPDFPGQSLPNFPGVSIPDIPSVSISGVGEVFPGLTLPDVPSFDVPDVPAFAIPDIPAFNVTDVPAFAIPDIPAFVIPQVPEIDLSEDLFEIPTIPTFSDILIDLGVCPDEDIFDIPDGYVYRLIEWGVQHDMQNMISFNPIDLAAKVVTWGVTKVVRDGGVTYGSKGADYAEYLPKLYPGEFFLGGEIVGVYGGKISKRTDGADQVLAISTKPLVLGNQPEEGEEDQYAKVGFLGQVPVFVEGPVALGDYVVPSGRNDGIGKVIKAEDLTAEILPLVVGRAWSEAPLSAVAVINLSVGLRPTEIAEVLRQRDIHLQSLREQLDQQTVIHASLQKDVDQLKIHLGLESAASNR